MIVHIGIRCDPDETHENMIIHIPIGRWRVEINANLSLFLFPLHFQVYECDFYD